MDGTICNLSIIHHTFHWLPDIHYLRYSFKQGGKRLFTFSFATKNQKD